MHALRLTLRGDAQVLAADAVEDERSWGDSAGEEAGVLVEVAEALWQQLLDDTAACVAGLEDQLLQPPQWQRTQGAGAQGAARRRMQGE
jgi:hypothetical protein